ncbi:MAG: 30S ribosomal protein S12 methylthiotransferase RimO [Angelakisella sp.]|nr:30S ribosomal protein S12 methylthiotransferase RimO [Angelakisella sp.]
MTIKVGMISLGCSKNQVDAERLLAVLAREGYEICSDMTECDAVIVNTCGFIEDAKKESIDTILECCAAKGEGRLKCVAVTGCLAERYRAELASEIPEVDVVLGLGGNRRIGEAIREAVKGNHFIEYGEKESLSMEGERILANEPWFAYVKVAEGCDNRCSYCAIPLIRGRFRSRPMENILEECRRLAESGVTELNLVAQDTTRYGEDLYGESRLPELIDAVCALEKVHWVRVLYCYPDRVTDRLIETIARQPKAVHYFDIPVQHASAHVLRDMNRRGDKQSILELCRSIRERIPDVVLRTTLIAGFPTETEQDFAELCELVEEARFDRLGCFAYSQEEDTPAGAMEQLPEELRRRRAEIVMELQMSAAFDFADRCVGRTLEVLVEGYEDGQYFGRSYMDAPDIDTKVYFTSEEELTPGSYVPVLITDACEYDLIGTVPHKEETT